jgi:hypothetical protein
MSFPLQHKIMTWNIDWDPAADDVLHLMTAPSDPPGGIEIKAASATSSNAVAANTANYFSVSLRNGGTAYSGTAAVAAAVGGTGGWTALTPKAFTISAGNLTAGQALQLVYDETGTGTFQDLIIQVEYVSGT